MRPFRLITVTFAGLGLLLVLVLTTPLVLWWGNQLARPWDSGQGDVLIVLAGSTFDRGLVGYSSYLRSAYAAWAFQPGGFQKMLITGGGKDNREAEVMARFIEGIGVPHSAILVEPLSTSTLENARFSRPILEKLPGRKVLLTSDYHMYRAWRVFRKAGLEVEGLPVPDAAKRSTAWNGRWDAFQDLCIESVKIVYYRARGWM